MKMMSVFRRFAGAFAVMTFVALHAVPSAAEGPAVSRPAMTPLPRGGITIVLPLGAVIVLPIDDSKAMPYEGKGDHVVGEDLC